MQVVPMQQKGCIRKERSDISSVFLGVIRTGGSYLTSSLISIRNISFFSSSALALPRVSSLQFEGPPGRG